MRADLLTGPIKEERMTKLRLLGTAAVVSFALAGPTMAQAETARRVNPNHIQNVACDPRDPGNPFSRTYDYTPIQRLSEKPLAMGRFWDSS
jgi:hypothetical protein